MPGALELMLGHPIDDRRASLAVTPWAAQHAAAELNPLGGGLCPHQGVCVPICIEFCSRRIPCVRSNR